jgi:hypothetical protein
LRRELIPPVAKNSAAPPLDGDASAVRFNELMKDRRLRRGPRNALDLYLQRYAGARIIAIVAYGYRKWKAARADFRKW